MTGQVLNGFRRAGRELVAAPPELTDREADMLRLIARGLTNAEIGTALGISQVTVKSHVNHIFTKLDLCDRAAAIVYAFDHGLVLAAHD